MKRKKPAGKEETGRLQTGEESRAKREVRVTTPPPRQAFCRFCVEPVDFRQDPDGSWHPYRAGERHGCSYEAVLAWSLPGLTFHLPAYQEPSPQPGEASESSCRVPVLLSALEVAAMRSLARRRNAKESRFGGMNYGSDVRGSEESHVIGLLGELAVARERGLAVDERITERGDDGVDLLDPVHGLTAVKTQTYPTDLRLLVEVEHYRPDVGLYVLCWLALSRLSEPMQTVEVCGWATAAEVLAAPQAKLKQGDGYPLNYVIPEYRLNPWPPPASPFPDTDET